ncbi:MAG: membrane protein insertion efficiency factor YidD [Firmicutes bacterium]|nr:membrane protein insertion efficiency factor YidD [Bacillota bacterium]
MNKITAIITYPFKLLAIGLIYVYKACISPFFPNTCIYQPTCSTYTLISIKRFGAFEGGWMGFRRILRCRPKQAGGLDPVPDNIRGGYKWVL